MRPLFLLASLSFASLLAWGQSPGGVTAFRYWGSSHDSVALRSHQGFSFVGVMRQESPREQALWVIRSPKALVQAQTTARTASFAHRSVLNYNNQTSPWRIYSYHSSSTAPRSTFHLGKTLPKGFPASVLEDSLCEYAVYERKLSPSERHRIESYFALKYGITLSHSYLNAKGHTIWDFARQKLYNHRIAGLINDSLSALSQSVAQSHETDAFLTLSTKALPAESSLLFGDNNQALSLASQEKSEKWIARRWSYTTTSQAHASAPLPITLKAALSDLQMLRPLAEDEQLYLAVDSSEQMDAATVQYYPATRFSGDSVAFVHVPFSLRQGSGHFALRIAPRFFSTVSIDAPSCATSQTGKIRVRLTGGLSPYRLTLRDENAVVENITSTDSLVRFNDLAQGMYTLSAIDATGTSLQTAFTIENADLVQVPHLPDTAFVAGEVLRYTLSATADYRYEWTHPNGERTQGTTIDIAEAGTYTLLATNVSGCSTLRTLRAQAIPRQGFDQLLVAPNPTRTGRVNLRLQLPMPRPLQLTLYSVDGKLISQQSLPIAGFHEVTLQLPALGTYMLSIESEGRQQSVKLLYLPSH